MGKKYSKKNYSGTEGSTTDYIEKSDQSKNPEHEKHDNNQLILFYNAN